MIEVLTNALTAVSDGFFGFFQRNPSEVLHDCLDIGLVAVLIYWALVILRGTRAMQVAIGLCLVFVGYLFARRIGLVTVTTILDSVLAYLAVIVVIIFQSDIRRALARMGRRPLLRGQRTAKETQTIEEVIKAAGTLANKRIGALIAFERAAALDEFIERGTEVDAAVSKELLHSIFVPSFENPMHDGAVVIREGRIWQAGVFLPMAGSAGGDRSLGARHRAGLGITEETDAVVVVVSEERGAISLCFDGNIVRNLDAGSLRDALYGLFYAPKPSRRKMGDRRSTAVPPEPSRAQNPDGVMTVKKAEKTS
ncbi:MAG: diadenylate cyclase CdaA [Polyangiales bacterium]